MVWSYNEKIPLSAYKYLVVHSGRSQIHWKLGCQITDKLAKATQRLKRTKISYLAITKWMCDIDIHIAHSTTLLVYIVQTSRLLVILIQLYISKFH